MLQGDRTFLDARVVVLILHESQLREQQNRCNRAHHVLVLRFLHANGVHGATRCLHLLMVVDALNGDTATLVE